MRPVLFQGRTIAAVTINLRNRVDQLAMAVVFGHRIGAAMVDATRHLAVGELVRRVPVDIAARRIGIAEPQQAIGHHRAITYPRACIGARTGPQGGTVTRDQDMCVRRAQRVGDALSLRRQSQFHKVELAAPCAGDRGAFALKPGRSIQAAEIGWRKRPGDRCDDFCFPFAPRRQL